jgi:hypothetical protein
MRTPAGKECRYFYGNYFRGREIEECRLLDSANPPLRWTQDLCFTCPVPEILRANACQNLILEPKLGRSFPFLKRRVYINTHCSKTMRENFDPHIGCGECHPVPPIFERQSDDPDSAA